MSFIKRNSAFILLSVSLTTIALCFTYAFCVKDNVTFYLEDITGDKNALRGITITGVLQDGFHGRRFEISDGEVKHRFKYYQKAANAVEPYVNYTNGISYGSLVYSFNYDFGVPPDATTKINPNPTDAYGDSYGGDRITRHTVIPNKVEVIASIMIRHKDFKSDPQLNYFKVPTGVFLENDDSSFEFEEIVETYPDGRQIVTSHNTNARWSKPYYDSLAKCMAFLDGKFYFTIPTTKEYSGENGIFVVDEFGSQFPFDKKEIGKGRKIIKWSLNDHNMDVLGLERVGDKLVLITAINDILTLKVYDKHGTLLDQKAFESIVMGTNSSVGIDLDFEAYTNDNILNICTWKTSYYGFNKYSTLISVEISDNIIPLQTIHRLDFDDNEVAQNYDIHTKGDRVYIVASLQQLDESNLSQYQPLRPRHFIIMVYQNSQLIYKGELVTDADEDFEMDRLKSQITGFGTAGFGYDPFMYRQFYGIELR